MGDLILHHELKLTAGPVQLFDTFDAGGAGVSWLFGGQADSVRVGGIVRLGVPLGGQSGLDGTARIVEVVPYRKIVMIHEAPWKGRIDCRFAPQRTGGTLVKVRVTLDEAEIHRLGVEFGLMRPESPPGSHLQLGLLTSMSGSCGLFGRSTVNCAELAVDEINADGGIAGRQVSLSVADDGTNPSVGAVAVRRLLAIPGLSAVVGMHTSRVLDATGPLAFKHNVPYLFAPVGEDGSSHRLLVRLGETPADQLGFALPRMAAETGGNRWFIAGNDYSWPRAIGSTARATVEKMGGSIVGEGYLRVGATDFEGVLNEIERSEPEHVIAAFIGQDHVNFEREFASRGLRSSVRTFAPLLDDVVREHLGANATGLWNTMGYFEGLDTIENRQFLGRYRAMFGGHAPPVSAAAATVYEAVHRWAEAVKSEGTNSPDALAARLRQAVRAGPRVRSTCASSKRMLLGEATSSSIRILDSLPGAERAS